MLDNFHCTKCNGFCPGGTLQNGLCSNCDLIGKDIQVWWNNQFWTFRVSRSTRNGNIYAQRYNKRRKDYNKSENRLKYYRYWQLA